MQAVAGQGFRAQLVTFDQPPGPCRVPRVGRLALGRGAAAAGRLDVAAVDRLGHPGGDRAARGGLRGAGGLELVGAAGGGAVVATVEAHADLALGLLHREGRIEEERGEGEGRSDGEEGRALHGRRDGGWVRGPDYLLL